MVPSEMHGCYHSVVDTQDAAFCYEDLKVILVVELTSYWWARWVLAGQNQDRHRQGAAPIFADEEVWENPSGLVVV